MRPERPDRHHWHDDRLGSLVRAGLPGAWRRARPRAEVWQRVAREIEPRRPVAWPHWLAGMLRRDTDGPAGVGRPRWVSATSGAVALSAVTVAATVLLGNVALLAASTPMCQGYFARPCVWDDMTGWELAIQPADPVAPLQANSGWLFRFPGFEVIDREARARRLWDDYEAYNRSEWLRVPPPPSGGPVAVLAQDTVVH